MKFLTLTIMVTFLSGSAHADGPMDFTTQSPVPIGVNAKTGVIVGIEAHKLGDIVRYLPVVFKRSDWSTPSRRLNAYLVSPSRSSFKEKYATVRRSAERLFNKLRVTQTPDLPAEATGHFRSFVEGVTVFLEGDRLVANTGGFYGSEKLVLFSGIAALNESCEPGTQNVRLLHVSVVPELGVLTSYVESACDTPKGVNYRRRLIIAEIPAFVDRLIAASTP